MPGRCRGRWLGLGLLGLWLLAASGARAGLYEVLESDGLRWLPAAPAIDADIAPADLWRTPARDARVLDPRIEPEVLVRTLFVSTQEEAYRLTTDDGRQLELDSANMDPSFLGHREGFVIENVELGLGGRFHDPGLYYKVKFELVPREKDGNRSSDYLKDAYLGWNRYTVFDARIGRMRVPFSRTNMKSTAHQALIYKPTINLLFPKRQLGLALAFGDPWRVGRVQLGVFNSAKQAIEQLSTTQQLMAVGRVSLRVDRLLRELGIDVLDFPGLPFRLELAANIAHVDQNFDPETRHQWVGADLALDIWLFTLEAEAMRKYFYHQALPDGSQDADQGQGFHLDLIVHAWPGVVDLALRYEEMDGDEQVRGFSSTLSIDELKYQKKRWISAGLSLFLGFGARLDFNYIHRQELEGHSFDNDVFLLNFQYHL